MRPGSIWGSALRHVAQSAFRNARRRRRSSFKRARTKSCSCALFWQQRALPFSKLPLSPLSLRDLDRIRGTCLAPSVRASGVQRSLTLNCGNFVRDTFCWHSRPSAQEQSVLEDHGLSGRRVPCALASGACPGRLVSNVSRCPQPRRTRPNDEPNAPHRLEPLGSRRSARRGTRRPTPARASAI